MYMIEFALENLQDSYTKGVWSTSTIQGFLEVDQVP